VEVGGGSEKVEDEIREIVRIEKSMKLKEGG
jgi:hypothetical protein